MQKPLLPLVTAMISGIAAGYFLILPSLPILAVLLTVFFSLLLSIIKGRNVFILPLAAAALFLLGMLDIQLSLYRIPETGQVIHHTSKETMTLEGVIGEDPQESPDGTSFVVAARSVIKDGNHLPAQGLIMLSSPLIGTPLKYGDLIRFRSRLRAPHNFRNPGSFDYEKQLRGRGILLQGRINNASDIVLIREGKGNFFKMRLERLRGNLRKIIEENSITPQKEIFLALLLGEKREIPPDVREGFNRTGTSHILAISGLHVGMVAAFAIFVSLLVMKSSTFMLLRFNVMNIASFLALIPVVIYAFIAGLGVSVVRAAVMILVFLVSVLLRKERDLFNSLALAAFIILLSAPAALFDVSFQLSFAAVAALIFAGPVLTIFSKANAGGNDAGKSPFPKRIACHILLFVFVSLSATMGTLPLIAYYFNGISTVSLPANCIIVPLMAMLVLPIGMAAMIAAFLVPALAAILFKVASFFIGWSLSTINFLSSLPGSFITIATPTIPEIACYYLLAAVIIKITEGKIDKAGTTADGGFFSAKFLKLSLGVLVIFFVADIAYLSFRDNFRQDLRITAIDVGQGSSIVLRLPAGKDILVDGGGSPTGGFDIGKYVVAPYLWRERIKELAAVILTHPHPDHLQGLIFILKNFTVREVWTNGQAADIELYGDFMKIVGEKGIIHRIMDDKTMPMTINGVTLTVLNPPPSSMKDRETTDSFEGTNDASLALKVVRGKIAFLIPGDISATTENRLIDRGADIKSDVLFVPHHGGFASSTVPFLKAVKPRAAILSCGLDNIFRLPHPDVLKRYAALPAIVYRTDMNGAVTVATDGKELTVMTVTGGKETVF